MHDFKPHTFDTRGLVFGLFFIVGIVGIFSVVKYGTAIASERFVKDANVAAAAQFSPAPAEPAAKSIEEPKPLRLTVTDRPLPKVSAKAFIIGDMVSGDVFAQKDASVVYPIASITKLLVALVAHDEMDTSSTIKLTSEDRRDTAGTPGSITRDESLTVGNALLALLMESNNTIAYALARTFGSDQFLAKMREETARAGMTGTTLEDPSGISENNAGSAADIFALTRYVYKSDPEILEITDLKKTTLIAESGRKYLFGNFNVFSHRTDFLGGKTGYTDAARETMTAVFELQLNSATATVNIVVLGSEDRKKDVEKLLAWFKQAATSSAIY